MKVPDSSTLRKVKILFKATTVTFLCVFMTTAISAQTAGGKKISPNLFGLFFEDINYAADGGLYAEMIQNRSFEYSPTDRKEWHPFSFWQYVTPGFSYGSVNVETKSPVHPNNTHYLVLNIEQTGDSGVGIRNNGFDKMVIKAGEKYNLSFFARLLSSKPIALTVSLQDEQGKTLADNKLSVSSSDWKKYTVGFTASANSDEASFLLLATTEGRIALDFISLFPDKTFMGRANGLRADIAQTIADIRPAFIRFPGGCLAHGDGLGNMYRWQNTVGPPEVRMEQKNIWGYHQTMGLGYFEYFQFCEDIGAKPLPVLPAAVSCQNSGGTWRIGGTGQRALPMKDMPGYIEEVLDLIEWANGPVTTKWGALRAASGHAASFNLEYIGIGNEDKITPDFEERFTMIYNAVKAKHPEITVIGTVGPGPDGDDYIKGWKMANQLNIPIVDEHYYSQPRWFISNQYRYDTYDRNRSKVYVGEYASWGNKMRNAVYEAAYMTALERNGDLVVMASYAPLLAKKGYTQWNPDMIYFDSKSVVPTVNYYVQKMFSTNRGDIYYSNVITQNPADSTLASSCVRDSKSGDIILKLVNAGFHTGLMKIDLSGFKKIVPDARKTELSGDAELSNDFDNPGKVKPVETVFKTGKRFDYTVPPMSVTVIRVKTKQ